MAGHAFAGGGALAAGDDGIELVEGDAVATDLHEGADHGTHHIAEEAIGGDAEVPGIVAVWYPSGLGDMTEGGLHIGVTLAKGAKVGDMEQMGGCLVHQVEIERPVYLAGIMTAEGIFLQMDVIVVSAERGTESGMHIGRYGPDV